MHKFGKFAEKNPEFSDHFSKTDICYTQMGSNIDLIKQTACLAVNLITVDRFAYLFNCTPMGQCSDSDGPDLKQNIRWSEPDLFMLVSRLTRFELVLFQYSIGAVWQLRDPQISQNIFSVESLSLLHYKL